MKSNRLTRPILLLLLTVLVPSMGMVWMMREAMRNERLASNQRLRDAYQTQLKSAGEAVRARWSDRTPATSQPWNDPAAPEWFARWVQRGESDSVLITDGRGTLRYPRRAQPMPLPLDDPESGTLAVDWKAAQQLEFAQQDPAAAAAGYRQIAEQASDDRLGAIARNAEVRCLLKENQIERAIAILETLSRQRGVRDADGRCLAASAELRLLQLIDRDSKRWTEIANSMARRLGDYGDPSLISSQRQFLMTQLQQWSPVQMTWPTQAAEKLATEVVATESLARLTPGLQRLSLPDIWCNVAPHPVPAQWRVVELYRTATLRKRLLALTDDLDLPRGVKFSVSAPEESLETLMDVSLGSDLGNWRLGLTLTTEDPFSDNARHRHAFHLWIALLIAVVTGILAWMLTHAVRGRMRLAQLKNDLVATVSHELKTPLASIRLLVDTLLESESTSLQLSASTNTPPASRSGVEVREYLQLISHENARLTRLIDQFLTFSRLEQGNPNAASERMDLRDVITQATAIFREHWPDVGDAVQTQSDSPVWVRGERDALVTAVVNLLENAWKYSDAPRCITIGCHALDRHACLKVGDNGIGMSVRDSARIFDQFFQVDQRVARTQGGCGLGLSIVRAIMQTHHGNVRVESQLGVGSVFTLEMPLASPTGSPPAPAHVPLSPELPGSNG